MNSALVNLISGAVIKAGKGLLRDFSEVDNLQVSRKGVANFVTAADIRTEKLLHRELSKARPNFGFLMEETGEIEGKDPTHRWIIDPLDGTNNFIRAVPYFCISVAVEKRDANGKSEIIAAVTFDPIHNELFAAEKGGGAYLNDRKLRVSARKILEDSMLVSGNPRKSDGGGAATQHFSEHGAIVRHLGASALDLAYVAAGRIDACWHFSIQPWDIAAGILLVQEAGGLVTNLEGQSIDSYTKTIIASNRLIHSAVQENL